MHCKVAAGVILALVMAAAAAPAGEPRAREPRPRHSGFLPEHLDRSTLHGRPLQPRGRPLYERVEQDMDRGRGRIVDEPTHQVKKLQQKRDERLRRVAPQQEFERFEEDNDRRRQIERRRQRMAKARREAELQSRIAPRQDRSVEAAPGPLGSPLARFVAEQEQLLEAARERYQDDLRKAEAERDEALRQAKTQKAKSLARLRFEQRRSELTRAYQQYRRGILGSR